MQIIGKPLEVNDTIKQNMPKAVRRANSIARKAGYGKATHIIFQIEGEETVISHTHYGYRKYSTGEYVPNAYRANFGWKNTYYQTAKTVVRLKINV